MGAGLLYSVHDEIASGGMGAVHLACACGDAAPPRVVAVKRLHAHLARVPEAVAAFLDEARLSARVRHPNVVATRDVVNHEGELLLVMDYVHGASLASLVRTLRARGVEVPIAVAVAVVVDVLEGLQAIHEAAGERDEPLGIVHRDVSPQNILVGADGVARVADFGIAKAAARLQATTENGNVKGKLRYLTPEQILNRDVDARTDAFAASVVLWELLTGAPLFDASNDGAIVARVLEGVIAPPSRARPKVPPALDAAVTRGLSRAMEDRFPSCHAMASALRAAIAPASPRDVGRWVEQVAGEALRERGRRARAIEAGLVAAAAPRPLESEAPTVTETRRELLDLRREPPSNAERAPAPTVLRWGRALGGVAAGALLVGAVVAVGLARRDRSAPAQASEGRGPEPVLASVAAAVPPSTAAAAIGDAPPPPPLSTSSSPVSGVTTGARTDARTGASPTTRNAAARASASTRRAVTAVKTTARASCEPMFFVDANGIRRVKPECL